MRTPRAIAHLDQAPCVRRCQRDRLFAENVLAVLGGASGPLDVQMIRQRDVNGVDLSIREKVVV
jgi:hypothetical protein